jgi:hypothetical protein
MVRLALGILLGWCVAAFGGEALRVSTPATPNALHINSQGDIGIGLELEPDPMHHRSFELMRSTNTDAAMIIRNRHDGSATRTVWHGFAGPGDENDFSISIAAPNAGSYVNLRTQGTTAGLNIIVAGNDSITFKTNDTERMRVQADGTLSHQGTVEAGTLNAKGEIQVNGEKGLSTIVRVTSDQPCDLEFRSGLLIRSRCAPFSTDQASP